MRGRGGRPIASRAFRIRLLGSPSMGGTEPLEKLADPRSMPTDRRRIELPFAGNGVDSRRRLTRQALFDLGKRILDHPRIRLLGPEGAMKIAERVERGRHIESVEKVAQAAAMTAKVPFRVRDPVVGGLSCVGSEGVEHDGTSVSCENSAG